MDCYGDNKHNEVKVVASSNTVVNPDTVMVESFYAAITDTAMFAILRTVGITRKTET